jgi:Na+/serine symporter
MFKRLAMAYIGVGFIIAIIENWTAHQSAGGSVLEVLFSSMSFGAKMQSFVDLVVVPIVAWPLRVWVMMKGG